MTSGSMHVGLLTLVLIGCGGATTPPVRRGEVVATSGNGNANGTTVLAVLPTAPLGRAPITLAPGFLPTPAVARGTAGGPSDAGSLNYACIGSVPVRPQHVVEITAPLPYLGISAYGNVDLTLAVHLPDGTWLCNDDWDGLNPHVEGPFGVGRVEVYVGTYSDSSSYSQGENNYTIGFSEDPSFMSSMLPMP